MIKISMTMSKDEIIAAVERGQEQVPALAQVNLSKTKQEIIDQVEVILQEHLDSQSTIPEEGAFETEPDIATVPTQEDGVDDTEGAEGSEEPEDSSDSSDEPETAAEAERTPKDAASHPKTGTTAYQRRTGPADATGRAFRR